MIQLQDVTKIYVTDGHKKVVLDHASMHIDTNWSYGIFGPNGAGKSTTLRLIAGTELPNSGKIRKDIRTSWPLGFAGGFHPLMTGRENVLFVARIYGADVRGVIDFVEYFADLGHHLDLPGANLFLRNAGAPRLRAVDGHRVRLLSRGRDHGGRRQPFPVALHGGARGAQVT